MNPRYSMDIKWSNDDQAFVVTLPEFPNNQTHGETYEAAVQNGQEVIELLVETYTAEGSELPEADA